MRLMIILFISIFLFSCNGEPANGDIHGQEAITAERGSPTKLNDPAATNPRGQTEDQLNSPAGGPDLKFADSKRIEMYGNMLHGEWLSAEDAELVLSFKNSKMKIMRRQVIKFESEYKINVRCEDSACDPIDNPPGVCVTTDGDCHFLYLITKDNLELLKASDKSMSKWTKV